MIASGLQNMGKESFQKVLKTLSLYKNFYLLQFTELSKNLRLSFWVRPQLPDINNCLHVYQSSILSYSFNVIFQKSVFYIFLN